MTPSLELKTKIMGILQDAFGTIATIHVLDGYLDNIHVWVVSPMFEGSPEYIRQDRVWEVLDAALADYEKVKVSLVLTFAPGEPDYRWACREHGMAGE